MDNSVIAVCDDILNEPLPFGKYKGQPVSVLANDERYCNWLVGQSWFPKQYNKVYNLIVNNFVKPEDTPEHNQLQGKFLELSFLQKLLCVFFGSSFCNDVDEVTIAPDFEYFGWDFYMNVVVSKSYTQKDEDGWEDTYRVNHAANIFVEIKPDIGDDFPSVMRQMKIARNRIESMFDPATSQRYFRENSITYKYMLVYNNYTGAGVSEESMRKMFEIAGFKVYRFDEFESFDLTHVRNIDIIRFIN